MDEFLGQTYIVALDVVSEPLGPNPSAIPMFARSHADITRTTAEATIRVSPGTEEYGRRTEIIKEPGSRFRRKPVVPHKRGRIWVPSLLFTTPIAETSRMLRACGR